MRRWCIGLLGTSGCRKPFFVDARRIDPDRLGQCKRRRRLTNEPLRMGRISRIERALAPRKDLRGLAVVDHRRRQQTDVLAALSRRSK